MALDHKKNINRFLIASTFAFLISACSATQIVANNIEWLAVYYVDEIIDLNDEQEKSLSHHLQKALVKIKTTEFSSYINLLNDVKKQLNSGTSLDQIKDLHTLYLVKRNDLMSILIDILVPLSQDLTAGQVDNLFENINRKKPDHVKQALLLSKKEQKKLRADRWLERLENWTDDLNNVQTNKFLALSLDMPNFLDLSQNYNNNKLKTFISLLKKPTTKQSHIRKFLSDWLILNTEQPAELTHQKQIYKQKLPQFLLNTHILLNTNQKRHFIDHAQGYINDLSEIQAKAISIQSSNLL